MIMGSGFYNSAISKIINGQVDWTDDTFKAALLTNSYTIDEDENEYWSDISANEVDATTYDAYITGGITLSNTTVTTDNVNDTISLNADNFTMNGVYYPECQYLVIYKDTGDPNTSALIGWYDFQSDYTISGFNFNTEGAFRIKGGVWTSGFDRSDEWIDLPEVNVGDEKLVGLYRINDTTNNYAAFTCQGDYTIDWGDGNTENVASGVTAEHHYTFGDIDASTETVGGWRQAIITITPQAGQSLTNINLDIDHSTGDSYTNYWLDMKVAGQSVSDMEIGGLTKPCNQLQQFEYIGDNSITSFYSMFRSCSSLFTVLELDTSSGTNFGRMFFDCSSLSTIPLLDTSSGTNFSIMFYGCNSLSSIPLIDTSSGTDFSVMFYGCSSLSTIPELDTSNGTNFGRMFEDCNSLSTIPQLDTSSGTSFGEMFDGCSVLAQAALNGTQYDIDYSDTALERDAIVDVFNALGTAAGTQTINVSTTPGAGDLSAEDIAIATDKGWTVVS